MLTVATTSQRRKTRRDFIRLGTLSLGSLSLANVAQVKAASRAFVRDKSVVLVYLSGGASQFETFDPKMTAPEGIRSVTGEVSTTLPGVTFGGTFERLARHAGRLAVVRSFGHRVGSHAEAHVHVLSGGTDPTGRRQQGFSVGSCCTLLMGANHPETGLPAYVLLSEEEVDRQFRKELDRVRKGSWPGSLGSMYGPLDHQLGWGPAAASRIRPQHSKNPLVDDMQLRLPVDQFEDRLALLRMMDSFRRQLDRDVRIESLDKYARQAIDLVLGGASAAFDLTKESPKTIARYDTSAIAIGHNQLRPSTLGKQLLLARRLCEAGCGFVTVHSAGWDMHADGNNPGMIDGMRRLGTTLDIALSAFLEDVASRSLEEKVLLVVTGDFGRTPKVNRRGGRDHWAPLSPLLFAGGGLSMGQVIGHSNDDASHPQGPGYSTQNLMASILHTVFDPGRLRLESGVPRELSRLVDSAQPIRELF